MDLFSMFKGEKPQQNQNQNQNQQADFRQNGGSSIQNSDNGIQPNQQQTQQQQNQQQNPLDSFTQLWQTPSQGGQQSQNGQAQSGQNGQPAVASGPESRQYVNTDLNAISGFTKNINFAQNVPPELMEAAMGGDPKAMINIINGVAQSALAHSLQLNGSALNASLNSGLQQFGTTLEGKFKDFSTKDRVYSSEDHKVLSHPAIQPLVETARRQILQNNPAATSAEVQQQLVSYFKEVSSAINPSQQQNQQAGNSGPQVDNSQDFSNFFNNQKSVF